MPLPITVDVPLLLLPVPDEPVPLLLLLPALGPLKPLLEEEPELLPERLPDPAVPVPELWLEPDPDAGWPVEVVVGAADAPLPAAVEAGLPASGSSSGDVTSPVAQAQADATLARKND